MSNDKEQILIEFNMLSLMWKYWIGAVFAILFGIIGATLEYNLIKHQVMGPHHKYVISRIFGTVGIIVFVVCLQLVRFKIQKLKQGTLSDTEFKIKELESETEYYKRNEIVVWLGKKRDPKLIMPIISSLKGGNGTAFQYSALKSQVTRALVNIGPQSIEQLIPFLLALNPHIQEVVKDALINMNWKPKNILEEAYLVIADVDKWSQEERTTAVIDEIMFTFSGSNKLRERGRQMISSLISALKDEQPDVKLGILQALKRITGHTYSDYESWSDWWKKQNIANEERREQRFDCEGL